MIFFSISIRGTIIFNCDKIWTFLKRVIHKIGKSIYSINLAKWIRDLVHSKKVFQYRSLLPELNPEDRVILEALQKTGTISIPIEDLQLKSTEPFLKKTTNLVEHLKHIPRGNKSIIDLEPHQYEDSSEIFFWGLEQRLLDVIEYYIGQPIYYQGYSMRRDLINQDSDVKTISNWHLDAEDRTVIKIIIYLNDVGFDGGFYEYIDKDLSEEAVKKLNYNYGYLSDQTIRNVVPQEHWSNCIGKLGTVIITETSGVFHHAKPPEKEDRFSISFCYTSNKPRFYWDSQHFFPKNLAEIRNQLNNKQRNALINKNKLFSIKL